MGTYMHEPRHACNFLQHSSCMQPHRTLGAHAHVRIHEAVARSLLDSIDNFLANALNRFDRRAADVDIS